MNDAELRSWLAATLAACTDGEVSAERIGSADCSFTALGIGSLALVRLVDAVDRELGVPLDFDGGGLFLTDLDTLAGHVLELTAGGRR